MSEAKPHDPQAAAPTPEAKEGRAFEHQEIVAFDDGVAAILFEHEGDHIDWDKHKYGDPEVNIWNRMLVLTESGNAYAMGEGFIVNSDRRLAKHIDELPEGIPDLTIGESWHVPGFGTTTKVKSVLFRHKLATPEQMEHSRGESPFKPAEALIAAAKRKDAEQK